MADATTTLVPDSFVRGSSNGYVADLAALGAIETVKDISKQLDGMTTRANDDFNAVNRAIDGVALSVVDNRAQIIGQLNANTGILSTQAERVAAATNVLVQKTTGELMTAATLNAKDSIIDASKNSAAITLQAANNAAAATLLATQLAAAQAKQACECCCEIKEKVGEEACSTRALVSGEANITRALINEIDRRHADRREADLKMELSNSRQTLAISAMLDERLERFNRRPIFFGDRGGDRGGEGGDRH